MERIFTVALCLLLFINVSAQQYSIKYYSQKEGLPNSLIPSIFQDSKGQLWFPTLGGGVSCFNGLEFKNYGTSQGLSNLLVRAVTEDTTGRMIFGTMGDGIFYMEGDTILHSGIPGFPKDVFSLLTDRNGKIWAATSDGLLTLEGNRLVDFTKEMGLPEYAVTFVNEDADGTIWFGYDEQYGLYEYDHENLTLYDERNGFTNGRVLNTFQDSEKNTWVSTFQGIYLIRPEEKKAERIEGENLPDYYVFDFAEPKKGILFIGSQSNGLLVFDSKRKKVIRSITQKNGLKSMLVFRVFKDAENNIWISNWGDGVARIHFSGFTFYREKEGIGNRIIYNIQKENGELVCSGPDGLMIRIGDRFIPYRRDLVNKPVMAFMQSGDELFCATEREFLVIKNGKVKRFDEPFLQSIKGIVKDKHGTIYLAGWNGAISVYDGNSFNEMNDSVISRIRFYYCAFSDSKGNLWFGTWDGGLVHYDGETWKQYRIADGLPSEKIMCLTEDRNGNIIAGTNGGGLVILTGDKMKVIDQSMGLPSNSVYSVAVDSENNLWAGFQGNVSRVNLSDFSVITFSSGSGFEGDCLMGSMYAEGQVIWVGTNNYLWRYDPENVIVPKRGLRVFIDELMVNYNKEAIRSENFFTHRQNKFSFHFSTTQIFDNESVKYKFRLLGIDSVFSPLSRQNEITFHELPPGDYTFEVAACLDNSCSEKPASFHFTIYPPFWKTWWFITLCGIFLLIGFRVYVFYREKKILEKQKELECIVKARTQEITNQKKIVEEKQKEILDSINYARRIQYALLAHDALLKENLPEHFVLFLPKDIVSGDFYWATSAKNNSGNDKFFLAVCDSTGHGVPGAFMSLLNISFLNEAINEKGIASPDQVLNHVRGRLIEHISVDGAQDGMDAILVSITPGTDNLSYAAAHNAPLLIRNGETMDLKTDKMPVGMGLKNDDFTFYSLEMQKGDVLYLYTDGYADQFGGESSRAGGKKLKEKNLKKLLLEIHQLPLSEQKNILSDYFAEWRGDLEQVDDVCIIGMKW